MRHKLSIPRVCEQCGKSFLAELCKVRAGAGRFCSLSCNGKVVRRRIEPLVVRFWEKVDRSGGSDACWPWVASCDAKGYGHIGIAGKTVRASRVAWELSNGPVPDGLFVLHNCPDGDNPTCVNPAHLWLGTHQDNMRDRERKGRTARGERGWRARLTAAQVREIRRRRALGESETALAIAYGVHSGHIHLIVRRLRWRHVA
jgi:hypothetical protein